MKRTFIRFALSMLFAMLPAALFAQVTLPWSENFDSYTTTGTNTMPTGWTRVTPFQASSSSAVVPNLSTAYNHGTVLNFMGQASASDGNGTMRIATPLIPEALNNLEISFDVYKSGLSVYLATDLNDLTTYTLVGSYSPGWVWTTYEIRTDTLTGAPSDQGYLVFCGTYGSSGYSTAYLDNLMVSALNSCARPNQVLVEQVTNYSADLTWDEVTGAQGYRVLYDTVDDLLGAAQQTTTATAITLTGLDSDRQYYVWVQTECAPGDYSDSRTATFTTLLDCYPPMNLEQVSTGFDAASFAWETDPRGNAATSVWTVLRDLDDSTATIEEPSTGETSHFVSSLDPTHSYEIDFYTICGNDTAAVATLPVVFKVCGESQLAVQAHNYDMHPVPVGYNYGYAQMMYPADVFLDMDTIRGIALHRYTLSSGATTVTRTLSIWMQNTTDTLHNSAVSTTGMTQVANDVSYTFDVQEWDTIYFTTPFVYTPGSNVILTIDDNTGSHVTTGAAQWMWHEQEWKTQYKNNDNNNPDPTGISGVTQTQRCPDMQFVGNCNTDLSCVAPVVAVTSVDSASATIYWVETGTGSYSVEYRLMGTTNWTSMGTVSGAPYTITDLQPATHYEVRVGLLCNGAETLRYSDIVNFTTGCALMSLPFHFTQTDMVAAADNGFTDCWNFSQYIYRGRLTFSHRGYLRNVAPNGEWIMLPAIADDLSNARLRMWAASSDHGYVKVGIASQPNASDVVWLDTVEISASQPDYSNDEYTVYLDNYTGTGNRVVLSPIANNDYHYIYFFAFHVEPIEDCRPVENLVLDSSSATSLSVSWTPRANATQWAVHVDGAQRTVVSGEPHCTLTGLSPYTEYEVSVRSLCGSDDSSAITSESFRTACSGEQCTFTISAHASAGEGWKGAHLHLFAGGELIEDFTMLLGSDLSQSYSVCANMQLLLKWYSGNEDSECSFALLNAAGDTVYSLAEGPGEVDTLYVTNNICTDAPEPSCTNRVASATVSACDNYLWHGRNLTFSGSFVDTVAGVVAGGCDSIYYLVLTLHPSYSTTIDTTAEESFSWHGTTYTESGIYPWSDTSMYGCDSAEVLYLTITHPGAPCNNQYSYDMQEKCDSYLWRGFALTASGTYHDTVAGAVEGGCDSIYTLVLTVNESVNVTIDITAEESFTWHDSTYTESGIYSWTGSTVNGCDSLVVLNLVITHPGVPCENLYDSDSQEVCDSYEWRGRTLTVSGNYSETVPGAVEGGCDSIYTLELVVNRSVSTTIDTTAEGSFTWHGATYTESGTYSWTGTTTDGCDSTVTLRLTITPAQQGIDDLESLSLALYPNPTTGVVKIMAEGIETVEVYDATGRSLLVVRDSDIVDLSNMAAGNYTLRVTLAEGTAVRRVVKY